jgi:hypothetical protein
LCTTGLGILPLLAACGQPDARTAVAGQASPSVAPSLPPSPTPGSGTPTGATATPTQLRRSSATVIPPTYAGPGPNYSPIPTVYRPGPIATQDPNAPVQVHITASRFPDTRRSVGISSVIVLGTIRQVLPARWNTSNGARPANPFVGGHFIYTPVQIGVETYYEGAMPDPVLWFVASSGQVGEDFIRRDDKLNEFRVGERVVVFLHDFNLGLTVDGTTLRYESDERYTVTADGQAVNSYYRTIPLQQLLNEITAAVGGLPPDATPSVSPMPTSAP